MCAAYRAGEGITTMAALRQTMPMTTLTVHAVHVTGSDAYYPTTRNIGAQVRGVGTRSVQHVIVNGAEIAPGATGWLLYPLGITHFVAPTGTLVISAGVWSVRTNVTFRIIWTG